MEIKNKKMLKDILAEEKKIYCRSGFNGLFDKFICNERTLIYKYLSFLRKEEYYLTTNKKASFFRVINLRKMNKLGNMLNIKIVPLYLGKCPDIHHKNIIVNGKIGDFAHFSGNNCIGLSKSDIPPTIGNNASFGFGSGVFGNITLGNNVKIGAGAIVVKNIDGDNITIVGVPGKKVE